MRRTLAALALLAALAGCALPPADRGGEPPLCGSIWNQCCWLPDGTNTGYCPG